MKKKKRGKEREKENWEKLGVEEASHIDTKAAPRIERRGLGNKD